MKAYLHAKFNYWTVDTGMCAMLGLNPTQLCLYPSEMETAVPCDLRSLVQLYPLFMRVLNTTGIIPSTATVESAKVCIHYCFNCKQEFVSLRPLV